MTKKELRKIFLQKRSELTPAAYARLNHQLCENFFAGIDLSFVKVLHTFLPIEKNKEPDTWPIINRITEQYAYIQLSIPRINQNTGGLENFFYEGKKQLEYNAWGIPEPKNGLPSPTEKIDMVLVPLLAFDKHGNRVGYGKGFYDKFLSTCPASCKRIGLSLFPPCDGISDIQPSDEPLTMTVTPDQVFGHAR
ncbi:MAG TPA: 5-formyltetrahydrofolate cyclo-ligase [Ohtaekwangia sp.]|nr:5-formyltetrahydrofolate cyclo-ligase [Ohtaekwangia sp.]